MKIYLVSQTVFGLKKLHTRPFFLKHKFLILKNTPKNQSLTKSKQMTLNRDFATIISVSMRDKKSGWPERTIMVKIRHNKSVHPPVIYYWSKWDRRIWHVLGTYVNGPNGTDENGAYSGRTLLVQIGRTRMTPPQDHSIPRRMKSIGTSMKYL